MKLLFCGQCTDIRSLDPNGAWTACRCGNTEARWLDPHAGTVKVRAREPEFARIIGVNNEFLIQGYRGFTHDEMVAAGGQWEAWKKLHDTATDAPGYIFDKSKRGCWACIVRVNETNDISWEEAPKPAPPASST